MFAFIFCLTNTYNTLHFLSLIILHVSQKISLHNISQEHFCGVAPRRLLPMTRVYVCIDVCKIARQLNSSVYLRQQILSEIILRVCPMWWAAASRGPSEAASCYRTSSTLAGTSCTVCTPAAASSDSSWWSPCSYTGAPPPQQSSTGFADMLSGRTERISGV